MAPRTARKLADNLDEKKVLSSDCTIFFARLERDIDAYVKGAASVSTGGLSGIGNPPMPVTKSRRESRFKTALRATRPRRLELGLQHNPLDVCKMFETIIYNALRDLPR